MRREAVGWHVVPANRRRCCGKALPNARAAPLQGGANRPVWRVLERFPGIWPGSCFKEPRTQYAAETGMANLIDKAFGVHGTALQLRAERSQLLAANLANADTPGFKARDIDFRQALAGAQSAVAPLRVTQENHFADVGSNAAPQALYRVPLQPSLAGNTVDVATEQAAFGENANRYLASLNFLNGRIRGLMTALRGE